MMSDSTGGETRTVHVGQRSLAHESSSRSSDRWWQAVRVGLWTLVSGASIGFLVGMSVTPVIQGVITVVLTLAVAVATALVGLKDSKETGTTGDGAAGSGGS